MSPGLHVLFVTWQAPESRRIFPIARVMRLPRGEYEWAYVRAVSEAQAHGFVGLPGYTDLERVTLGPEPPAPFAHRVPSRPRRRPSTARNEAAGSRGTGSSASPGMAVGSSPPANDSFDPAPITLLVPAGGGKHERLEVFAPPLPGPLGRYWGVFVARGVGRVPGSETALASLVPREPLRVEAEPDNPYNPRALRLLRADGSALGYLPDYLANELAEAQGQGSTAPGDPAPAEAGTDEAALRVELLSAERVTHPPAEPVYHVLCQYTCAPALGARLFRSERYRPVAADAATLV